MDSELHIISPILFPPCTFECDLATIVDAPIHFFLNQRFILLGPITDLLNDQLKRIKFSSSRRLLNVHDQETPRPPEGDRY